MPKADNKEIVSACIKRWDAEDSRTVYFSEHFDEWILQIPDNIYDIVLRLLEKFEYYSQKSVNRSLYELGRKLDSCETFNGDTAVYTHIPSRKGIENSSIDYLYDYKNIHGVTKYKVAIDLKKMNTEEFENVVVIDDFCGSGGSLKYFLEVNSEYLRGKTVYYLVTYAMDEAITTLHTAAAEYNITLNILYINHAAKAFDDVTITDTPDEARKLIKSFSQSVGIPKDRRLGVFKTESLVSFYGDTPNNTIGIFCYDTEKYFSLFPRSRDDSGTVKRPSPSSMRGEKKQRNIQNYNASIGESLYG
ncbi:hypothetical protein [uncultured Dysosmobacter sp.]|uniref:phosphoribosyltransferase-like protein n=1 Tax=uncultured Dysosmobacter sp. TaxID=2591384 RepID=UPI00261AC1D6|nr:hypothetical protein [uncultured Dysosmobacter sp.]